jgi:uncharacterized protein (DUF1778 family)
MARPTMDPNDTTTRVCISLPSRFLAAIDRAAHLAGVTRSRFCRESILKNAQSIVSRIEGWERKLDKVLAAFFRYRPRKPYTKLMVNLNRTKQILILPRFTDIKNYK